MFSVSYWYFISHRWVHFYCTHLSVMCLYMCLLIISLFFLILSWRLWLSVSLCSRLLWSIPDNVICWVPDVNLRLSRWFTLVCSWFYFFLFISRDQYTCWQEVTIINPSNISFILILFSPLIVIIDLCKVLCQNVWVLCSNNYICWGQRHMNYAIILQASNLAIIVQLLHVSLIPGNSEPF